MQSLSDADFAIFHIHCEVTDLTVCSSRQCGRGQGNMAAWRAYTFADMHGAPLVNDVGKNASVGVGR